MTGGVTPKNIDLIEGPDSEFMHAYLDKGCVRPLLDKVPLFAVMTEDLGVRGAYKAAVMVSEADSAFVRILCGQKMLTHLVGWLGI